MLRAFLILISLHLTACSNPLGGEGTIDDQFQPGLATPATPFDSTFQVNTSTAADYVATGNVNFTATTAEHADLHIDASDAAIGFGGGTKSATQFASGALELTPAGQTAKAGTFLSRVFTANATRSWDTLALVTSLPTGKPLLNNEGIETVFTAENIDMTGNVLLLHMDEASYNGTVGEILDTSGKGHHGQSMPIVSPASPTEAAGRYGRGVQLNAASTQYLRVPHHADLDNTTSITVEAWIKPSNLDNVNPRGLISKRSGSGVGQTAWSMFAYAANKINVDIAGTTAGTQRVVSSGSISNGSWQHIAFTYTSVGTSNTVGNRSVKFYINGTYDSEAHATAASIPSNPTSELSIGFLSGNATTYTSGSFDEIAIYRRVLSASEIAARYRRGARRLKLQVTGCTLPASCTDASMVGPNGTAATFFTPNAAYTNAQPTLDISSIGSAKNFRYKAFYELDDSSLNVGLGSVTLAPVLYDATSTITKSVGLAYTSLSLFDATYTGDVTFQLSNGTNWYYWNGSWSVASSIGESSPEADIATNIASFPAGSAVSFRAVLNAGASSSSKATLTSVRISGTTP